MPDLVHPDFNDGKLRHILWKDELCISCLNNNSCPLIQCIYSHKILTHSGVHVANCDSYSPDIESEYYVPENASIDHIAEVNAAALRQQIDILTDYMTKLTESLDVNTE